MFLAASERLEAAPKCCSLYLHTAETFLLLEEIFFVVDLEAPVQLLSSGIACATPPILSPMRNCPVSQSLSLWGPSRNAAALRCA